MPRLRLLRMMAPTARAAFGLPAFVATCLYVSVPPFGMVRTISRTFSAKVFIYRALLYPVMASMRFSLFYLQTRASFFPRLHGICSSHSQLRVRVNLHHQDKP